MPFDEKVKVATRQRGHFACCLCHDLEVEVHHIVPEADGGPSTSDNAAPLCPSCHERYGANPTKRKFIREARDLWFDICHQRYAPDDARLTEIQAALSRVATKGDLEQAVDELRSTATGLPVEGQKTLPQELGCMPITPQSIKEYLRFMYPVVAHAGPDPCIRLAEDLTSIGYVEINSLHAMIGYTSEPFAEVMRSERDKGETRFDIAGDIWPVRLFLAVLDENYCKIHYADLYNRKLSKQHEYPWRRRIGDPVPRVLSPSEPKPPPDVGGDDLRPQTDR